MRVLQSVSYRRLSERAAPCKCRRFIIEVHCHVIRVARSVLIALITLLFPLETHREGAPHCVTQPLARVLAGVEAVAHPSASRSVTADIREAALMATVRRAEGDFLYCLVHYQALRRQETCRASVHTIAFETSTNHYLCFLVDNAQTISGYME